MNLRVIVVGLLAATFVTMCASPLVVADAAP